MISTVFGVSLFLPVLPVNCPKIRPQMLERYFDERERHRKPLQRVDLSSWKKCIYHT
jgi:hypothetical protein